LTTAVSDCVARGYRGAGAPQGENSKKFGLNLGEVVCVLRMTKKVVTI